MRKKKKWEPTLAELDAHQRQHGFKPLIESSRSEHFTPKKKKLRGVEPPKMNRTEAEFEVLLKAQKSRGDIQGHCFQGVRLRWGDGMNYKADFAVLARSARIRVIEVKGTQIWDRDIVRFKGCRAEWKKWFDFEMWQRDENKQWNRLL